MAKKKQNLSLEELLEQALVPECEWPYRVPENWVWTKIGKLGKIETGTTPSKSEPQYYGEGYPFFKPTDLEQEYYVIEAREYLTESGIRKGRYIPEESILVTCIGATIGKTGFSRVAGSINQQINAIIPSEYLDNEFVYWGICSPFMQDLIISNSSSTTLPILNKSRFEELVFPLPPLAEQQRIVDRIESLFEKLDQAKGLIQDALDSFENRKAAILHKAFSGELTKKWREENGVGLESWEETELGKKIKLISGQDVSSKLCNDEGIGVPYILGASNLDNNTFTVERWIEAPNVLSLENDILISVKGTIGKVYFQKEEKINISRQIMAVRNTGEWDNEYLYYQILSISDNLKKMGNGLIPGISRDKVLGYKIILPTVNEQHVIASLLKELFIKEEKSFILCNKIDEIDLIKKSILARAFSGKLGTNDKSDENAIELLKMNVFINTNSSKTKKKKIIQPEVNAVGLTIMEALKMNKRMTPEQLKEATELEIDDFYEQIKMLINRESISEIRENDTVYLEVESFED